MLAEVIPHEVTVCTVVRGREPVERLLAALDVQSLPAPGFDLVIGDATPSGAWMGRELSYRYAVKIIRVDPGATHGAQMNACWRAAKSDAIAFLSPEVVPDVMWLWFLMRNIRRGRRLVTGRWLPTGPTLARAGALSHQLWAVQREAVLVSSEQLGCRRADLDEAGGFDENIDDPARCDLDLAIRLVEHGAEPFFERRMLCEYDLEPVSLSAMLAARQAGAEAVRQLADRPVARGALLSAGVLPGGVQPRVLLAAAGLLLMVKDRRAALLVWPWWHTRTCVVPHAGGPRRKRYVLPGVFAFDLFDAVTGLAARIRPSSRQ